MNNILSKSLSFVLCLFALNAWGQDSTFTTKAKPQTDTTTKKGFFKKLIDGDINTSMEKSIESFDKFKEKLDKKTEKVQKAKGDVKSGVESLNSTTVSDSLFTTKAKPKVDTSGKKGGFFQNLIGIEAKSDFLKPKETFGKIKKTLTDKVETNKKELDRINGELASDGLDLGLKGKKISKGSKKEKKAPKDEYVGIKMVASSASFGNGNSATFEEFNVVKEDDLEASTYAPEVRWYDYKLRRTVTTPIKDKNYSQILHGPYKRYVGEELVEEGNFYMGTKDGRWERYGKEFDQDLVLLDKQYFWRGFPLDSKVSFYDKEEKKLKEVIPVTNGKTTGMYYAFYDGGQKKMEGHMDDSVKVGVWREFYQFGSGGRTKKVMQYGKDKFDTDFIPFVTEEYDEKGKQTFKKKAE